MRFLKKPLGKYLVPPIDIVSTRDILVTINIMSELSDRQIKLLGAIINEYLFSQEPVGSTTIVKKYPLDCSAATVRNEMSDLLKMGFLEMPHTSSGRVPTSVAYRLFITELIHEEDLPVLQEVAIKQRLWSSRFQLEKLLKQAVSALSEITKEMAVAIDDEGFVISAGVVNVLDAPEFWDISAAKSILYLLDRHELLQEIFDKAQDNRDVNVIIGDESGQDSLSSCAIVFSGFEIRGRTGEVAVIGPSRMNYASVIPAVRYTRNLVQELGEAW